MKKLSQSLPLVLALLLATNLAHADLSGKNRPRQIPLNPYVEDFVWQEKPQVIPPYASAPQWLELPMPASVRPKVFVDISDMQLGEDEVIRYTLRQLSSSGIENISREGLYCIKRQLRSYAYGDTVNKRWIEAQNSSWRGVAANDWVRRELIDAMCPKGWAPPTLEEVHSNLNKAAHIDRTPQLEKERKL